MKSKDHFFVRKLIHTAILSSLLAVVPLSSTAATAPADIDIAAMANAQARATWHDSLNTVEPPTAGCWSATYPSVIWKKEACGAAPGYRSKPPVLPKAESQISTRSLGSITVGNGNNYAARTRGLTQYARGSFPTVLGVESEFGIDSYQKETFGLVLPVQNRYSLQINTNTSKALPAFCERRNSADCSTWQQFIYAEEPLAGELLIQNWLFIGKDESCPADPGWQEYIGLKEDGSYDYHGCVFNSDIAVLPFVAPQDLDQVAIEAQAVKDGKDTVRFEHGDKVYAVTQEDSTLDIASTWRKSEFNIDGFDSNSPLATFNPGSYLTVQLEAYDGSNNAPQCVGPYEGETFEGNNLTLGNECRVSNDTAPRSPKWIRFGESNIKGYPDLFTAGKRGFPGADPSTRIYF